MLLFSILNCRLFSASSILNKKTIDDIPHDVSVVFDKRESAVDTIPINEPVRATGL